MFKKPLSGLKTSAPLRSSDRRKLKQRVITGFSISSDDGDLLVPEGILSVKFSTHLDEPGVSIYPKSHSAQLITLIFMPRLHICLLMEIRSGSPSARALVTSSQLYTRFGNEIVYCRSCLHLLQLSLFSWVAPI